MTDMTQRSTAPDRKPVRVLIVEDSEVDALLMQRELERYGSAVEGRRVDTAEGLHRALADSPWDVVLADYAMPRFNGIEALEIVKAGRFDLPFIIVSGTIGEEIAVEAMRAGADDYVLKDRMTRLGPAVERALREAEERRARKMAEYGLRNSEERYRSLFENMLEGFAYCGMIFEAGEPQDFVYLEVNKAFEKLTGLKNVIGRKVTEVIPGLKESNPEMFKIYGRVALTGNPEKFETFVDSLGIWFSLSVYSPEREHFVAVFDNITARKRSEDALRESEEQFRLLFENSLDAILLTIPDGTILRANPAACQMFGMTEEEIRQGGKEAVTDLTDPRLEQGLEVRRRTGRFQGELNLKRKDGSVLPAELSSVMFKDAQGELKTTVIIRDISQRQKSEQTQRRLATAVEQAAETIVITDDNGIIQYVNPAFETITGYTKAEAIGQNPHILKSGQHETSFYRQMWDTIKEGHVWSGRFINRRKDGRLYHEDATISPVKDASGKIVNFVAVKRDITDHVELSRQLLQAQKMEAVGTLAGGVAHDFNNILQVALGYSELILGDEEFPQRYKADLRQINESARRGAELVQRLLTFSRKTEVKPLPLNLNRRIESVNKMLERTIPKMIEIQLVLAEDLATINADPTQVDQILMNLAVNARDAMPEGGRVVIETANLVLDEEYAASNLDAKPGLYVLLSFADTGAGMDKDTLERIFEPFYTTKEMGTGTGLGLATVYGIVQQHGGRIRCYSEPNQGTTFKIYFPALVSDEEPEEKTPKAMPPGGSETILLVDDEVMIRDLCSRILTKAGYKVIAASNGKEALEAYRLRRGEISLVLLDLIMPEMSGKQCLESLLEFDPSVKVLIASGHSPNVETRETLSSRAKGFVDKPYNIRQVLEIVRKALDEGREESGEGAPERQEPDR